MLALANIVACNMPKQPVNGVVVGGPAWEVQLGQRLVFPSSNSCAPKLQPGFISGGAVRLRVRSAVGELHCSDEEPPWLPFFLFGCVYAFITANVIICLAGSKP